MVSVVFTRVRSCSELVGLQRRTNPLGPACRAGTDFESKLVAKPNAAERLRAAFLKRAWRGELVVFSGNTDCYQPLEASYQTTRACLKVCAEFANPVGIITKSSLILRDLDLLQDLKEKAGFCIDSLQQISRSEN